MKTNSDPLRNKSTLAIEALEKIAARVTLPTGGTGPKYDRKECSSIARAALDEIKKSKR